MTKYNLLERILFPRTAMDENRLTQELKGKTVLITGASSGIGERLAYALADLEVHMILVARRVERLMAMKDQIERKAAKASVIQADLRNDDELAELLSFIHELPGGLDYVVSNAGISINRSIHQSLERYHDFTRTMAINYFAPVQLLLSVIPILERNKGQIINISTVNALLAPMPHWAAYQASKSAFDAWFRSAAPELNKMGISTTSIYLPLVKTPMIKPTAAYDNMPAMSAHHVADIICQAMYSKRTVHKPWWLIFGQLGSIFIPFPIVPKKRERRN